MVTQTVNFPESTSRNQSQTVNIANLKSVTNATVNTGDVNYSVSGNNVTINVSNGTYTRYTTSNYTPSDYVTRTVTSSTNSFSDTISVTSPSGYTGSISKSGSSYVQSGEAPKMKYISWNNGNEITQNGYHYMRYRWTGTTWEISSEWYDPATYYYSDSEGYTGTLNADRDSALPGDSPVYPNHDGTNVGDTSLQYDYVLIYYDGPTYTADTRVYAQDYAGYVYGSTQTIYTYYYAYDVTLNYDIYTAPSPPTITYPTTGIIISTSPTNIIWTAGSDADTATNSLVYQIEISINNGNNWEDIATPYTTAGVTNYSYNFLQQPDTSSAQIRIRTYDGSMYSNWYTTGNFTIIHKNQIGVLKIQKGDLTEIELPIYDPSIGMDGKNQLLINTTKGIGCFELVNITDVSASPFRINANGNIKSLAKL